MTSRPSVIGIAIDGADAAEGTDPWRKYVLWSNGRIDAVDGATPITSGPNFYARTDQPVAVAMWITNWQAGQGYLLDYTGKFWPLNGAPALGTNGYLPGVPYSRTRRYIDWAWNPANNGQGYVLDHYGQLYAFGGATTPPRRGPRWGHPCAKRLRMKWGTDVRAIVLDMYGGLWPDFAMPAISGSPNWAGWDAARDFVVTDWSTGKGYVMDLYGGHNPFGGSITITGFPYKQGVDCGRRHHCLDPVKLIFWVCWEGGTIIEFEHPYPPTVIAGGGTYEVQTVTLGGAPTGGTFTLTFNGQTTAAIPYNATAAQVDTALENLSNIGAGDVSVTGGYGQFGTPFRVTFLNALAFTDVPAMTATNNTTAGQATSVTVATETVGIPAQSPAAVVTATMRPTLAWSYNDAANDQAAWELYVYSQAFTGGRDMSDPSKWKASAVVALAGRQPSQRGVVPTYDFGNGTYTFYVRSQNKAGLWSAWSSYSWTQNVAPPVNPSALVATGSGTEFAVTLTATCTVVSGPQAADRVTFEYSEDAGITWTPVRGAETVLIAATVTVADRDIPLGVTRRYRAFAYKQSPRFTSASSPIASATITNRRYVLTSTEDASLGGEVFVKDAPSWDRESEAGVFAGVGAKFPTVVSDGIPKARVQTITVECDGRAQWELVRGIIESDSTLLFRDPFGDKMYCRIVGGINRKQQRKMPYPTEVTPLRHNHLVTIPLQEIEPPAVLDVGFTAPPGPTIGGV